MEQLAASTAGTSYPWPLQNGTHSVHARMWAVDDEGHDTDEIRFHVN